ncbi:hypothetical protein H6775_03265 [Candidatus Nomurabacteria bacterium]|nr:hypothetical protein [Candidatus Nomurabacteria bacterium]
MRSIEARFNRFNKKPVSSYLAFSNAVKGQGFSRDSISRNFVKLVYRDDYLKKDKKQLIDHLENLSNSLRSTQ